MSSLPDLEHFLSLCKDPVTISFQGLRLDVTTGDFIQSLGSGWGSTRDPSFTRIQKAFYCFMRVPIPRRKFQLDVELENKRIVTIEEVFYTAPETEQEVLMGKIDGDSVLLCFQRLNSAGRPVSSEELQDSSDYNVGGFIGFPNGVHRITRVSMFKYFRPNIPVDVRHYLAQTRGVERLRLSGITRHEMFGYPKGFVLGLYVRHLGANLVTLESHDSAYHMIIPIDRSDIRHQLTGPILLIQDHQGQRITIPVQELYLEKSREPLLQTAKDLYYIGREKTVEDATNMENVMIDLRSRVQKEAFFNAFRKLHS